MGGSECVPQRHDGVVAEFVRSVDVSIGNGVSMIDIVENDIYRHMNDAGLFDYDYIERGVPAKKGGLKGGAVGLGKGILGLVCKPVAGSIDLVTYTTRGMANTPRTISV